MGLWNAHDFCPLSKGVEPIDLKVYVTIVSITEEAFVYNSLVGRATWRYLSNSLCLLFFLPTKAYKLQDGKCA